MFTDMVGFSALSQRSEALALELLEEHRWLIRGFLPGHGGREVKTIGDGFLIEFPSALNAVRAAIEIQTAFSDRNKSSPPERQVHLRIGIHVGDVVQQDGDIHGDGVNIAARIEPLAQPGGICLTNSVRDQIENKIDRLLVELTKPELKNIKAKVQVYRVVLEGETIDAGKKATPAGSSSGDRSARPVVLALAILVLALVAAILFLKFGSRLKSAASRGPAIPPATDVAGPKSIAVLPFVNMGADKSDEYIGDGMSEELLNLLAKVKGLRVPGRTSSFAFKGRTEDGIFRKVGEELQVNTVLEGSVRKAGDKLRITAQLINVADGYHLWSETYDGDMKDILAFQSNVAKRVVQALQVQLGVEEARALTKPPTQNPEAYRLYLLGRYHFAKFTRAGWINAIRYFEQALLLDPGYALAYCGLADTYGWCGGQVLPGREAWEKGKDLALKALALDPNLADAHVSLSVALFGMLDFPDAEKEVIRALELDPNLALAYDQYAWTLLGLGRFEEAVEKERKALELDPLNPLLNTDLGQFLMWARRYGEAIAQLRKTLELDANNPLARTNLGWCLQWNGQIVEALAEFQKATTQDDLPVYLGNLGYAYAASGDQAKAGQVLRDLDEMAKRQYVSPANRAVVYLGLGEKAMALDWLEKAFEDIDPVIWWMIGDQLYDSVRQEPRFQALVAKRASKVPRK